MFLTIPLQHDHPYRLTGLIACLPTSMRPKFYILVDEANGIWVETNIQKAQNNDMLKYPSVCNTTWLYRINGLGHGGFYIREPMSGNTYLKLFIKTGLLNPDLVDMAMKSGVARSAALENKMMYDRITFDLEDLAIKEN